MILLKDLKYNKRTGYSCSKAIVILSDKTQAVITAGGVYHDTKGVKHESNNELLVIDNFNKETFFTQAYGVVTDGWTYRLTYKNGKIQLKEG